MSAQATISSFVCVPTTAISGAGATTGRALNIRTIQGVSFQSEWTGTLAGTFSFEVSNYPPGSPPDQPAANAKWTALTLPAGFAAGNPAGSAGDFDFSFVDMPHQWIRVRFTYSSGSGNLTVTANAKGI